MLNYMVVTETYCLDHVFHENHIVWIMYKTILFEYQYIIIQRCNQIARSKCFPLIKLVLNKRDEGNMVIFQHSPQPVKDVIKQHDPECSRPKLQ